MEIKNKQNIKDKTKPKDDEIVTVLPKEALINVMGVPSGRKDGKGEKVTVIYLAGRNPM